MLKKSPKTSWNCEECSPVISPSAYVDDGARVIGDVRIGESVYVAPGASLRADEATPIIIGDKCNIQDGAIFHGLKGSSIELGRKISIAHGAVIHGPLRIGDESFVGFNSVVHASVLGKKCFVGHGALVIGVTLKDGSFVPHGAVIDTQDKANSLGPVPDQLKGFNEEVVEVNCEFAAGYR
ncbi:MAG: carbonate dehydratase [Methanosarcinales archaeon]|nr:carbonate dehydratase [Methanosarcinales archaeon]